VKSKKKQTNNKIIDTLYSELSLELKLVIDSITDSAKMRSAATGLSMTNVDELVKQIASLKNIPPSFNVYRYTKEMAENFNKNKGKPSPQGGSFLMMHQLKHSI
jgi:hypothetical protein